MTNSFLFCMSKLSLAARQAEIQPVRFFFPPCHLILVGDLEEQHLAACMWGLCPSQPWDENDVLALQKKIKIKEKLDSHYS